MSLRRPSLSSASASQRRVGRRGLRFLRHAALVGLLVACGSRTGLFVDEEGASRNGAPDSGLLDGSFGPDSPFTTDGGTDALPPIDATPPLDGAIRTGCPDASATLIYVITESNDLLSFDPASFTFSPIGTIVCPAAATASPFSMAVDRTGIAYVLFTDGTLFRVSTATAACIATPFQVGQSGFETFGMGYATNAAGPTETLYVAGDDNGTTGGVVGLAMIDTDTFHLASIGGFIPSTINLAELTGTGDGRLFAFWPVDPTNTDAPGAFIAQIDPATARATAQNFLPNTALGQGWAFAFYGGDFYTFTAPHSVGSTVVDRFTPGDQSVTRVANIGSTIVGAGVSTCAPAQ